jgi:CdiI immunity protein
MTSYPLLWQFFGGYLHQDWPDDYPDEWAAVEAFVHDAPSKVPVFRAEIATLLAEHPSEEDVRHVVLDELESCFAAEVAGWAYRAWLQALSDHAERVIERRQHAS